MIFSPTLGRFFRETVRPRRVVVLEMQGPDGKWRFVQELESFQFSLGPPNGVYTPYEKGTYIVGLPHEFKPGQRVAVRAHTELEGYHRNPYNSWTLEPAKLAAPHWPDNMTLTFD